MTDLHRIVALAIIAATAGLLVAAAWSVVAGHRSGGRRDHRFAMDRLVLIVEALVLVNAALGATLAATGLRPSDSLHLLYGPAAMLTLPIGWALGARGRRTAHRAVSAGTPGCSARASSCSGWRSGFA